jgi:hypothetical protein
MLVLCPGGVYGPGEHQIGLFTWKPLEMFYHKILIILT